MSFFWPDTFPLTSRVVSRR